MTESTSGALAVMFAKVGATMLTAAPAPMLAADAPAGASAPFELPWGTLTGNAALVVGMAFALKFVADLYKQAQRDLKESSDKSKAELVALYNDQMQELRGDKLKLEGRCADLEVMVGKLNEKIADIAEGRAPR